MDGTHPLIVYFPGDRISELTAICNERLRVWWTEGDDTAFMYQVADSRYPAIIAALDAIGFKYRAWDLAQLPNTEAT